MKRITIERNKNAAELKCAGLIEGETDDGRRWILFLDENGTPEVFWPERDEDGAVTGDPVALTGPYASVIRQLNPDGADEVVTSYPIWDDGMRGVVFAVSAPNEHPRDNTHTRLVRFLDRLVAGLKSGNDPAKEGWDISDEDREAARFDIPHR